MKTNIELEAKIDRTSEAGIDRQPQVLASSSLHSFSRRLKHLKLWVSAKLDSHHERTLALRVHRQNRTD